MRVRMFTTAALAGSLVLGPMTVVTARADGPVPVPSQLQPVVDAVAPAMSAACGNAATGAFLVAIFGSRVPEDYASQGAAFPVVGVVFLACSTFPTPADRSRCSIDETLVVAVKQVPNGGMVPITPPVGTIVDQARALGKLLTGSRDTAGLLGDKAVVVQTLACKSTAVQPVPQIPEEPEPPSAEGSGAAPALRPLLPQRRATTALPGASRSGEPRLVDAALEPAPAAEAAPPAVELDTTRAAAAPELASRRVPDRRGSWWLVVAALLALGRRFAPRAWRRGQGTAA